MEKTCKLFPVVLGGILWSVVWSLTPLPVTAADLDLRSESVLYVFETDSLLGTSERHTAFYEHLAADYPGALAPDVDLHLYGWARLDPALDDSTEGELSSGYLEYRHRGTATRVRAGRFFITEGTAMEVVDGAMVKSRLPAGLGASLFAGSPVEDTESADEGGDSLFGGRGFFNLADRLEMGLTWLTESGDFAGQDREEAGLDLWARLLPRVEFTGRSVYNLATEGTASYSAAVRLLPSDSVILGLGGEGYAHEHLLQAVTNAAFSPTLIDPTDEVTITFVSLDWKMTGDMEVSGEFERTSHSLDDPGDANRGEVTVRLSPVAGMRVGVSAASVTADLPENRYRQIRGFVMTGFGPADVSLDVLSTRYEVAISGEDAALQVVGSAGMDLLPDLHLSGDVRYLTSPTYDRDLSVFIKAVYSL